MAAVHHHGAAVCMEISQWQKCENILIMQGQRQSLHRLKPTQIAEIATTCNQQFPFKKALKRPYYASLGFPFPVECIIWVLCM